ncbi:unnamed protein product [Rhizophagus irregularis]|nr:unnamed protein product [Rhizophagus irregularis]
MPPSRSTKRTRTSLTKLQLIEENSIYATFKRSRQVKVPQVNEALKIWVGQALSSCMFISDTILKEKAIFFAHNLGVPENTLTFSNSWITRFKKRNGF